MVLRAQRLKSSCLMGRMQINEVRVRRQEVWQQLAAGGSV
jgi:hypothetical protein